MKHKRILDESRLRRCPKQFSWVDHRLVRLGHLRGRSPHALALYLLLVCVGDAAGVSWYGEARLSLELGFSASAVRQVRDELIQAGLVAYEDGIYQVLALDDDPVTLPRLDDALGRLGDGRVRR